MSTVTGVNEPKTLLLHIGTAKTGTSSIQESLAQAQECGAIRPVCYPLPWKERNHLRLGTVYLPYERLPRGWQTGRARREVVRRRYRRALFAELRAGSSAILSSEMLPLLNVAEARALRKDLDGAGFRRIVVIVYVRDPADFYVSRIQQDLKTSSRLRDPHSFRYPFLQIATTWETVFPGSLVVRRYLADPEFDVVQDFSGILRESLDVDLPPIAARLNSTISAEGMEILQRYRANFWGDSEGVPTPDTARLVAYLERSRSEIGQTAPALRPEIAEHIRASHRADAEVMRDRYGLDLGLADARESSPPTAYRADRVGDVLSHIDTEVVTELLEGASRAGLCRNPS